MPGDVGHHAIAAVGLLHAGAVEKTLRHAGQLCGGEIERSAGFVDVDGELGLQCRQILAQALDLLPLGGRQAQTGATVTAHHLVYQPLLLTVDRGLGVREGFKGAVEILPIIKADAPLLELDVHFVSRVAHFLAQGGLSHGAHDGEGVAALARDGIVGLERADESELGGILGDQRRQGGVRRFDREVGLGFHLVGCQRINWQHQRHAAGGRLRLEGREVGGLGPGLDQQRDGQQQAEGLTEESGGGWHKGNDWRKATPASQGGSTPKR